MLLSLDSRKRIPLGKLLKEKSTTLFDAQIVKGCIILEPMRTIPDREAWLYKNPKALAMVKQGLRESPKHKLPDMSKYLDDE